MRRVVPAFRAKLLQLQAVLVLLLIPGCRIIAILTIAALQCDYFAHQCLSPQLLALSFQFQPFADGGVLMADRVLIS
jgi:hypothetical protein